MWITFKSKLDDEKNYDIKINLNKIEHIILYEEKIELYPAMEENFYVISKDSNENFEEIKKKLMEL
jgi:hypothetical protein